MWYVATACFNLEKPEKICHNCMQRRCNVAMVQKKSPKKKKVNAPTTSIIGEVQYIKVFCWVKYLVNLTLHFTIQLYILLWLYQQLCSRQSYLTGYKSN